MEESYQNLIQTLEESVKKNGEKPLTNKWLLNILKLSERRIEEDDLEADMYGIYPWEH